MNRGYEHPPFGDWARQGVFDQRGASGTMNKQPLISFRPI